MDRQKNMHHNNQNRQNSSTGTVPKSRSNREAPREIVSRVVAPIVRDRPHHNITSNNLLLDWQHQHIEQQYSPTDQGQRFINRDSRPPSESDIFEQVVNGVSPSNDQSWLPVVRPQIRKRNQSNMSANSAVQHSSSNTAIVLPTTPNMMAHSITNGVEGGGGGGGSINSHSSNDMYTTAARIQDRGTQVLLSSNRSQVDERLNHILEYINLTSNLVQTDNQAIDQSNDLNSSMNGVANCDMNDTASKRRELELKMDISNRKMQALQNQHTQLLRIQESAKQELQKLKKHKLLEQQQLQQQQHQSNQTNKVYSIQSTQQYDNASQSGDNPAHMHMHNQTDFSFQPVNPMTYSLQQNNENLSSNQQQQQQQHHNAERHDIYRNSNYNLNQQQAGVPGNPVQNGRSSVNSDEVTSDNNAEVNVNLNGGDFTQVDENLVNISKRLFAVDAIMETRAELEALSNSAFMSAQNDYDDKLRELQNKKQQMDSLVADLQQLNKQAARDADKRACALDVSTDESNDPGQEDELDNNQQQPRQPQQQQLLMQEQQMQVAQQSGQPQQGCGGGVMEGEIARINTMKMQLTRLKKMMDTMKYIEAQTGESGDSPRSSSRQSSVCEQSPSTVETLNYPESWASSTMKPNNVDSIGQIPYKALISSDNENLNSVSNWLDSEGSGGGSRGGAAPTAPPSNISLGGMSLETVQSLSQELREQASALSAERERLAAAHGRIVSGTDRSTSMSSNYSNRPEKRVNQVSQNHMQKSGHSSMQELLGPKERQQQVLKAELEAKKRELEDLMKKDRDLSSRINQDASTSSAIIKQETSEVDSPGWGNEQMQNNNSNYLTRKSSTQSVSTSELLETSSRRVGSRSRSVARLDSDSTAVTSLHDAVEAMNNNQQQQQSTRNASRQTNASTPPPVPPPMPEMTWRKSSQDSSNATTNTQNNYRPYELNSTAQSQIWMQQRIAQQIQAQLEMCLQQYQNAIIAATSAANQNTVNQSTLSSQNPVLPPLYQQSMPSYANPLFPTTADLGLYRQYCSPAPPPNFGQYCGCNSALWQTVWMQQREIANIGSVVCSLQERLMQMSAHQIQQNESQSGVSMTQQRTLTSNNPSTSGMHNQHQNQTTQENVHAQQLQQQQQQQQQSLAKTNAMQQNRAQNNSSNPNVSSSNSQSTVILLPPAQLLDTDSMLSHSSLNSANFNNACDLSQNSGSSNYANANSENAQYVHNNTDLNQSSQHNLNLQNPSIVNSLMNLCQNQHVLMAGNEQGNASNLTAAATTLNNQVAPGNRANNYWDNFRSYSRQNLLSGNSKTKELVFNQSPSPLVQRSHNSLRSAASMSQLPGLKSNASSSSESQQVNQMLEQVNVCDSSPRVQAGSRNVQEIQPDVLNINPNVVSASSPVQNMNNQHQDASVNAANFLWNSVTNGAGANYPEIVQSHSSFVDVSQQNLKANLPLKSTGANKKRSKISVSHVLNNEYEENQQHSSMSSEGRHDLNLLMRGNQEPQPKSTVKPFDQLRDAVYGEVTALIAQNESRPQYLLQLFRDLRQVGCDPLRQRALHGIRDLVAAGGPAARPAHQQSSEAGASALHSRPAASTSSATEDDIVLVNDESQAGAEGVDGARGVTTPLHQLAEAQSSAEQMEQRCSSTSDAHYLEEMGELHEAGATGTEVQSSASLFHNQQSDEDLASVVDVSCSEASCSSYMAVSTARNSEASKSTPRLLDNPISPRLGQDNSDVYSLLVNAILSNSSSSSQRMEDETGACSDASWGPEQRRSTNTPAAASNTPKSNGNVTESAMPCNEDLAEADQVRGSNHRDEMSTSAVGTQATLVNSSRNNRQMSLENDSRSGDGPTFGSDELSLGPVHDGLESASALPLPDLARVGPGGDPDAAEANRSVSNTGLEHGLDRVPTRLSNGPWSPQPTGNENIHDTSTRSSNK